MGTKAWIVSIESMLFGLLLASCASPQPAVNPLSNGPAAPTLQPPSGAMPIAAGGSHTCALTAAGGVKCWGDNASGQLGDGTTTSRPSPVDVQGLPGGVTALSAGLTHTCALTAAGGVKCWGGNVFGDLGDGTTTERDTPVDVSGLGSGVMAIASGEEHTCALTVQGGVLCWGSNDVGQLGDGTENESPVPVAVSGLQGGVVAIAAGAYYSCALTGSGNVDCWGNNVMGQLAGDGTPVAGSVPTPQGIAGLGNRVSAIAAGQVHTCVLTTSGGVVCWGFNDNGQLGDGTTADRHALVDVKGLAGGVTALAARGTHTCAVTLSAAVECWGSNQYGELGDGTTTERHAPVKVSGLTGSVQAIAAGEDHTCVLTTARLVLCWGRNDAGQLGSGSTANSPVPAAVTGFTP
jgi:alpha-tubulin suppressor-like RCC1 family protein